MKFVYSQKTLCHPTNSTVEEFYLYLFCFLWNKTYCILLMLNVTKRNIFCIYLNRTQPGVVRLGSGSTRFKFPWKFVEWPWVTHSLNLPHRIAENKVKEKNVGHFRISSWRKVIFKIYLFSFWNNYGYPWMNRIKINQLWLFWYIIWTHNSGSYNTVILHVFILRSIYMI